MTPTRGTTAEVNLIRVLCRKPETIVSLPQDILDDLDPKGEARSLLGAMFDLHQRGVPVTQSAVVETGVMTAEQFQARAIECSASMLRKTEFEGTLELVRKHGMKRKILSTLSSMHAMAATSDVFDIEDVLARMIEELARIGKTISQAGTSLLADILAEYFDKDESEVAWRLPTGYEWVDYLTRGIGQNELWVISGQFKVGKTQIMRMIVAAVAWHLHATETNRHVVHIAHDGGNKYKHGIYYLAMQIQMTLLREGLPIVGYGKMQNGKFGSVPLISPYNIEAIIRSRGFNTDEFLKNRKVRVAIPAEVINVVKMHVDEFRGRRGVYGRIRLYDAGAIKHDINRMVSIFERESNEGAILFSIDHAGELGDPSRDEVYKRTSIAAQVLSNYAKEHDCCVLALSQVTQTGIANKGDSDNPNLAGGNELAIKADQLFRIVAEKVDGQNKIKMTASHSRFTEGGKSIFTHLSPYFSAGVVIEEGFSDAEIRQEEYEEDEDE